MTELEKLKAGLEYCYDDEEVDALKERAIIWCGKYNALDPLDFEAQYEMLKENLGSVSEKVWIAKTFNCDNGKNIHIGYNFTGNYNLTILDIREVYIEGLKPQRKGRRPKVPDKTSITPECNINQDERLKQLEEENLKLRIEVAYLKELRRLRLEQEAQKRKQGSPTVSEDHSN